MRNLMKHYRRQTIVSCLLFCIPMLLGILFWERMTPPGIRYLMAFGIPLLSFGAHLLCLGLTAADPKNENQNPKAIGLLFWVIPTATLAVCGCLYWGILGRSQGIIPISSILIALLFIVFGNYFPKIRQNSTLGIRLPWTLANEENWVKTHRFGGKVWVAGGFSLLLAMLLPEKLFYGFFLLDMLAVIAIPTGYSYALAKKQGIRGTAIPKGQKTIGLTGGLIGILAVVFCIFVFAGGKFEVSFGEDALSVKASFVSDLYLHYDVIDDVQLRETDDPGSRTFGYGSPRLTLGTFQNAEFGSYTRYTYAKEDSCVVIRSRGNVYVINGKDAKATKALYDELLTHMDK